MQFKEQERARLQALLNDSERAVQRIEESIGRYQTMLPIARLVEQKPSEIKKDAEDLHQALQTLVRIIANGGEAWDNFKASAAEEGLAAPLHCLAEALGTGVGEPGEALASVAQQNAADMTPTRSRPRSPEKAERFVLLFHVIGAANDAGVPVSRSNADFLEIIETAYEAAGISNRTHGREFGLHNAENDLKEYLKKAAE
jgi:hypothetical protein